jgi:glycine/sarcosine/betaine reductase complex component A
MDPNDQASIQRLAEQHDGLVVLLGAADPEALEVAAETVTIGDPSFVGPLAGVSLGLHVFHILEEDIKAQIDPAVWDDQLALLEVALDIEDIRASMSRVREKIGGGGAA